MTIKTFMPKQASTQTMAVTTTSARIPVDQFSNAVRQRVLSGGSDVYFEFGDANVTATVAASASMAAGATETFTKGNAGYVAAICASGTASFQITPGEGL